MSAAGGQDRAAGCPLRGQSDKGRRQGSAAGAMRQPLPHAEGGATAQGEGCARCAGFSERRERNVESAARKKTKPRLDSPDRMKNNAGRAKRAREPLGRDWLRSAPPSRCGKRGGRGDARGFGGERGEPRTEKV